MHPCQERVEVIKSVAFWTSPKSTRAGRVVGARDEEPPKLPGVLGSRAEGDASTSLVILCPILELIKPSTAGAVRATDTFSSDFKAALLASFDPAWITS
eukprot:scaffold1518_cov417-Prasinococcus_capsulatus_cf.AAC.18